MNQPLSPEQWVTAREFAAKAGASKATLSVFDEEIRLSRQRELRVAAVQKLKSIISEIEAGTLEPVGFSQRRDAIEGVSPCGSWVTHEPAKDIHYSFTFTKR